MVAERIRFHLDEHIDPDIAAALRRHGIDVTTTVEAGLRSTGDEAQFEFANSRQSLSIRRIIRGLILIHEVLSPDEIAGRTEFL